MGMFDDIPIEGGQPPIRYMEPPSKFEQYLAGIKMPKWMENIRGTAPVRVLQGAADPMIGAMQTVANTLPDSTGIPQAVNKKVAALEADYQNQRKARGSEGTDVARFVGNLVSPVNLIGGEFLGPATTGFARAGQGALMGGASAATAPVADTSNGFWGTKSAQVGMGATTGAILTPVLGKVAEVAARKLNIGGADKVRASTHDLGVEEAIADALKETGQSASDLSPDQMGALRQQVSTALTKGQVMNPAAALRRADFDALGIDPTLGQITRDPMQFARERNLRGIEGVGDPLLARFYNQEVQLGTKIPQDAAKNPYQAGGTLLSSLENTDDVLRKHVSGLYREARASAGKDLELPTDALINTYNQVKRDFGDRGIPPAVQQRFEQMLLQKEPLSGTAAPPIFKTLDRVAQDQPGPRILGTLERAAGELGPHGYGIPLSPADYAAALPQNMQRPGPRFTFEDANSLRTLVNDHVGNDGTVNKAMARLRAALNDAQTQADVAGGPFAPAVSAAAERFKMHDAIPALKAAAEGSVAPDDFVRKYIINGKTDDVHGLASVLKQADPGAFQEARAQIADQLRRAAYGENLAGDGPFAPARYMATVRQLGPDKLKAFFSPDEVQDIMTVGRVGAYIKQAPASAPVSTSNSNAGVVNVLTQLPGLRQLSAVANNVARPIQNRADVRNALAAQVPVGQAPLTEGQKNWLAYIMSGGAGGAGFFAGGQVGR